MHVVDVMLPLTKYAEQPVSADTIPSGVREAFRLAAEERPGAVHLELPEDIATEETAEKPFAASLLRRPLAEDNSVYEIV